ncbi:SWIM zinc finger family protein [Armatimonas sp.]|uniref:SWIM zinc finger family protein n=1 Tax=Armatimonas sp. TaxID=1872638 RepID=UPI00374CD7DB
MSWGYYKPTRRKEAKGGIQARSKRGAFGETWWGRRWMETLESFGMESRLARGRSYARSGQVLTLDCTSGAVAATVQGSQSRPYNITISLKDFTGPEWERVIERLRAEPSLIARLLGGELPEEIEEVFQAAKLSLFPARQREIQAECSCPDWGDPCKHTAAVFCLLAEELDRDPFLIFALRGKGREELLTALTGGVVTQTDDSSSEVPEPLPTEILTFWEGRVAALPSTGGLHHPPLSAPLLHRLGPFPFWRGELPLAEALTLGLNTATERLSLQREETT